MFGTAGRGAPCAGATRSLVVCGMRTQASYFPLSSPWLCLFKAPTATVGVRAQDFRRGPWNHQGASPALSAGTAAVMGTGLGAHASGVQPGQWEALGKSCYCVFGNPVIIVFAVMISVSAAISLGKSVPTCVFYRETFLKIYIR